MAENAGAVEWIRRFTDSLSPEGYRAYAGLRDAERRYQRNAPTAEERHHFGIKARRTLDELPVEEARKVERAWQLWKFRNELSRSAIADDLEELDLFTELSRGEQRAAAAVLGAGEASTVEEALAVANERRATGEDLGEE